MRHRIDFWCATDEPFPTSVGQSVLKKTSSMFYKHKTSNGTMKSKITKTKSLKAAYVELNEHTSFSLQNGIGHSNWFINAYPLTLGHKTT
jgi:hypothetical protein